MCVKAGYVAWGGREHRKEEGKTSKCHTWRLTNHNHADLIYAG